MPQVPQQTRKERAARLRAHGAAALDSFLAGRVGRSAKVLIESEGFGRCEHYAPVALDGGAPGRILRAEIIGTTGQALRGRLAA